MLPKKLRTCCEVIVRLLNHDFCPNANSYLYWLKQPIGWVVCGTAASLLVGLFIGPQGYVLTGAFLTLLVLGVCWPWLCTKGIRCELRFDESRTTEGESTIVSLDIINRLPIPAFGLMIQGHFLQELNHEDDVIAVSLKRVAGCSISNFQWQLSPQHRGEIPTEPPMLVTGFPFGIYQISKPIEVTGNTIVWPKCEDLETSFETVGTQFSIDAASSRQAGNEGETIGVRNYRYGDSVRNIHWSHTARHNRLIIRERQSSTQTPIRVVLDLRHDQHSGSGSQSTYEASIRMAASVCRELHRHQSQIELVCVGLKNDIVARSDNHRGMKPVMDFLALLPQLRQRTAFAKEAIDVCTGSGRVFTFLIHTDQFSPPASRSNLRCLCIGSTSTHRLGDDVQDAMPGAAIMESALPAAKRPICVELPTNDMGASHATT